jgi:hypothetical protein
LYDNLNDKIAVTQISYFFLYIFNNMYNKHDDLTLLFFFSIVTKSISELLNNIQKKLIFF